MILYRDIFSKSLQLAWRHKFLWGLAVFALLVGNGGEFEVLFSGTGSISSQSSILAYIQSFYRDGSLADMWSSATGYLAGHPWQTVLIALLVIAIALAFLWLTVVSQAGIIGAIAKVQAGASTTYGASFRAGMNLFVPVFFLNLAVQIIVLGLLALSAVPLAVAYVRTGVSLYDTLYAVVAFLILVPLNIIASFTVRYAILGVVLRGRNVRKAVAEGWKLFWKNWMTTIEVALVLFLLNFFSSLVLIVGLYLLGLPTNPAGTIIFFALIAVLGMYLQTFQYSTWVLLFLEFEKAGVQSKIQRLSGGWGAANVTPWTAQPKSGIGK